MILYFKRDFSISTEKQKKQVIQEIEKKGEKVVYISSDGRGTIQAWTIKEG